MRLIRLPTLLGLRSRVWGKALAAVMCGAGAFLTADPVAALLFVFAGVVFLATAREDWLKWRKRR